MWILFLKTKVQKCIYMYAESFDSMGFRELICTQLFIMWEVEFVSLLIFLSLWISRLFYMQVIFQYATIYLYNIICGFVRIPEITTKCGESHKRCLSLHNQIISYLFLNFKVPYLLTLYLMLLFFIWLHAY